MSQVLSSVISDHTVTFFAQSRMFTIQSDHINYKTIRDHLIAEPYAEAGPLIELADVRVAIQNASPEGLLKFVGDALSYKDKPPRRRLGQQNPGLPLAGAPLRADLQGPRKPAQAIPACGLASASRSSRKSRASAS